MRIHFTQYTPTGFYEKEISIDNENFQKKTVSQLLDTHNQKNANTSIIYTLEKNQIINLIVITSDTDLIKELGLKEEINNNDENNSITESIKKSCVEKFTSIAANKFSILDNQKSHGILFSKDEHAYELLNQVENFLDNQLLQSKPKNKF